MNEDDAALDRWFLEYAKPHFMKILREQVMDMGINLLPGDEIQMHLREGDRGFLVPSFVVEKLREEE